MSVRDEQERLMPQEREWERRKRAQLVFGLLALAFIVAQILVRVF